MALTRPRITQLNTDVTKFDDPIIEINAALTGANTSDLGIIMNRGTSGNNAGIFWDESIQQFAMVTTTADGDSSGDITYALTDLQVNSISTAGFSLPSTDGTVGQVISTDGLGVLDWVDAPGGLFAEDINLNIVGGTGAGVAITTGAGNFIAGAGAGASIVAGDGNIIIGNNAGPTANQTNKLYIDIIQSNTPLIGGDFLANTVTITGSQTINANIAAGNALRVDNASTSASSTGLKVTSIASGATITANNLGGTGNVIFARQEAVAGVTVAITGQVDSPDGIAGFFKNTDGTDTEISLALGSDLIIGSIDGAEQFKVTGTGDATFAGNIEVAADVTTPAPLTTTSAGNNLGLRSGAGGSTSGNGGNVNIVSGASPTSGSGGNVNITTGASTNSASGSINLSTGAAGNNGGSVVIDTGFGTAPGNVIIKSSTGSGYNAPELRFNEVATNGTNYVALRGPSSVAVNRVWHLPQDDPSVVAGQFLTTNASGILSFAPATGGITNPMTADLDTGGYGIITENAVTSGVNAEGINIKSGDANGLFTAGNIDITAGAGTASYNGGDVTITGGAGASGYGGNVKIRGGTDANGNGYAEIGNNLGTSKIKFNSTSGAVLSGPVALDGPVTTKSVIETSVQIASTGAVTVDMQLATYFYNVATTGIITFTFSNPTPAANKVSSFTIELFGGATNAPIWPASVAWPGGTEPVWSTGIDIVSFITRDNGTTYYGLLGGLTFA